MKINPKYVISIVCSVCFLGILLFSFYDNVTNNWNKLYNVEETFCKNREHSEIKECEYYISGQKSKTTADTLTIFSSTLYNHNFVWINCVAILFIILPCLYDFCKVLKSKMIVNMFNRDNYYHVLKKCFFSCLQNSFVVIIPLLILLICSYIYSGHFDFTYALNMGNRDFYFKANPFIYILLYMLSIYMFTIFFINIGLIVARKNHSIIVVLIESFLVFLAIDVVIEIVIGTIIGNIIVGGRISRFNILNVLYVNYASNYLDMILFPLILLILSFIILKLKYNNKEKFIIDIEKNN